MIATRPPPPDLLAVLLEGRPSAVAIVVADEFEGAATSIYCDPEALTLGDVDLSFAPQSVDAGDRQGSDNSETDGEGAAPSEPAAIKPPDYDVLVRLLGDIRVDGGSKQLNPKPTSVVAYLSHHFPTNRDGTYKAGPRIRTDLELFDWHVGRAADQEGPEAIESYGTALDLVTGKPFTYANASRMSFGWVDFEHHATTWEHRISGVAKAYTELCLDLERHDEAIDLLRHLLQAVPLSSGIVEALMRAHLANGDRSAAEALYQEHAKALDQADLGDPDEAVEQLRLEFTCQR